jgi:ATP-binding cassette subfamily C protein
MKKAVLFCRKYIRNEKGSLLLLSLLALLLGILSTIQPLLIGYFFDSIVGGVQADFLISFSAVFFIITVALLVLGYLVNMKKVKLHTKMSYSLNRDMLEHVHCANYQQIKAMDSVYLTQRINTDSTQMITFILELFHGFPLNILCIILPVIIIGTMNILIMGIIFEASVVCVRGGFASIADIMPPSLHSSSLPPFSFP